MDSSDITNIQKSFFQNRNKKRNVNYSNPINYRDVGTRKIIQIESTTNLHPNMSASAFSTGSK